MRYTLNIDLGNAAMSEPEDLAAALRAAADQMESAWPTIAVGNGRVYDTNGNTVGSWEVEALGSFSDSANHVFAANREVCVDCGEPVAWDERAGDWRHLDAESGCFLNRAESRADALAGGRKLSQPAPAYFDQGHDR